MTEFAIVLIACVVAVPLLVVFFMVYDQIKAKRAGRTSEAIFTPHRVLVTRPVKVAGTTEDSRAFYGAPDQDVSGIIMMASLTDSYSSHDSSSDCSSSDSSSDCSGSDSGSCDSGGGCD